MNKALKIIVGVMILLAILSGAFLLFGKKKPLPAPAPKTVQASAQVKPLNPVGTQQGVDVASKGNLAEQPGLPTTAAPKVSAPSANAPQDRKALVLSQWTECKAKTFPVTTNLLWSVQITEAIPAKGTYAKGNVNGDAAFPVRVIIKSDSQVADKIKAMLVAGKTAFLRSNCTDVATDGSVVLQAF